MSVGGGLLSERCKLCFVRFSAFSRSLQSLFHGRGVYLSQTSEEIRVCGDPAVSVLPSLDRRHSSGSLFSRILHQRRRPELLQCSLLGRHCCESNPIPQQPHIAICKCFISLFLLFLFSFGLFVCFCLISIHSLIHFSHFSPHSHLSHSPSNGTRTMAIVESPASFRVVFCWANTSPNSTFETSPRTTNQLKTLKLTESCCWDTTTSSQWTNSN